MEMDEEPPATTLTRVVAAPVQSETLFVPKRRRNADVGSAERPQGIAHVGPSTSGNGKMKERCDTQSSPTSEYRYLEDMAVESLGMVGAMDSRQEYNRT